MQVPLSGRITFVKKPQHPRYCTANVGGNNILNVISVSRYVVDRGVKCHIVQIVNIVMRENI